MMKTSTKKKTWLKRVSDYFYLIGKQEIPIPYTIWDVVEQALLAFTWKFQEQIKVNLNFS